MAQKVQFIVTVLHKPKLLIFDEPFSGFDPINANLIKDEILKLNKEGAICLSGILEGQINIIKDAYLKYFNLSEIKIKDGWVMMSGIKL